MWCYYVFMELPTPSSLCAFVPAAASRADKTDHFLQPVCSDSISHDPHRACWTADTTQKKRPDARPREAIIGN